MSSHKPKFNLEIEKLETTLLLATTALERIAHDKTIAAESLAQATLDQIKLIRTYTGG